MTLTVTELSVRYGSTTAVDRVSLTLGAGQIVAVLGPSGSGKTSLLRAIAGLEPIASGRIAWDGHDITGVAPHRRNFGLMFQDHALFAHRNVLANVAFGLRMRGVDRGAREARAATMLDLVGLTGFAARSIDQLSGGERQRVALARALAPTPRLLMLDEPLASVDRERRDHLAAELHRILRTSGTPTLLVTHDLDEAFTLADVIVVLDHGQIVQMGAARDVWRRPASRVVARFLGVITELNCRRTADRVATPWGTLITDRPRHHTPIDGTAPEREPSDEVIVGFRATDLRVHPRGEVEGTVRATWFRRDHFLVELDTAVGAITARSADPEPIGTSVRVTADLDAAVVIDPNPNGA